MKLICECGNEIKFNPYGKTYDSEGLDPEGIKIMRVEDKDKGEVYGSIKGEVYFYCNKCKKEFELI